MKAVEKHVATKYTTQSYTLKAIKQYHQAARNCLVKSLAVSIDDCLGKSHLCSNNLSFMNHRLSGKQIKLLLNPIEKVAS